MLSRIRFLESWKNVVAHNAKYVTMTNQEATQLQRNFQA